MNDVVPKEENMRMESDHDALERAIRETEMPIASERLWRIEEQPLTGRTLVAARALTPGTLVFREKPLVAAPAITSGAQAMRGSVPSVALDLLAAASNMRSKAKLLQSTIAPSPSKPLEQQQQQLWAGDDVDEVLRAQCQRRLSRFSSLDAWVREVMDDGLDELRARSSDPTKAAPPLIPEVRWALGVASINSHGASHPTRGVLGLLSSMPQHSCRPACSMEIGPPSEGHVVSLRTRHALEEGQPLSISYVDVGWPRSLRQAMLRLQYGFECCCEACCGSGTGQEALGPERQPAEDAPPRPDPLKSAPPSQPLDEPKLTPFLPTLLARTR